jgi:hypothetical protein
VIKAIDASSGLVTISIGSDAVGERNRQHG